LKILCLPRAPLDYVGGIPAYCLNLYKDIDLNVDFYSYDINKGLRKKIIQYKHNLKETIFPSNFIIGTIAISFEYFYSIIKNQSKYEYIHLQLPDPFSVICVLIAKILNPKIKIIFTWHAEIYKKYIFLSPILYLFDILISLLSYKIIFFTEGHIKRSSICKFKFIRSKIKLIPCCIPKPSNKYKSLNNRKTIANKKLIKLVSIGRLVEYKGYEYSIKALKYLDLEIDLEYKIIGEGPLKNKLIDLIKKYNLKDKVYLLGHVSNEIKEEVLSQADIFLFPSISQSEAYGLVQLEAMHFGLPIINTYLGNGVNYLANKETAITCPIKDPQSIAISISKLISEQNIYENLSKNGLNNVSNYDLKDMKNSYLNIFI